MVGERLARSVRGMAPATLTPDAQPTRSASTPRSSGTRRSSWAPGRRRRDRGAGDVHHCAARQHQSAQHHHDGDRARRGGGRPGAGRRQPQRRGQNKKGPDGKLHDSFSKTEFAVKAGVPTKLRIDNKDDVMHSISSTAAGVSIMVQPGVHTYTLLVNRAGHFRWLCAIPCDSPTKGWAMTHAGYMAGYITAS